jgi:hypothetical protein
MDWIRPTMSTNVSPTTTITTTTTPLGHCLGAAITALKTILCNDCVWLIPFVVRPLTNGSKKRI